MRGPVQFGLFLQAVGMPKLEKLTIYKRWSRPALQSFLSGANHPIKELGFVQIRDDDLFNCLELVPSLTHLHCTSPELVLRAITHITDQSTSCLCPHLDFVELSCQRPFDALVEMIEGRCYGRNNGASGASRLTRARLHLRGKPYINELGAETEARWIKRIQQRCDEEGLDIVWHLPEMPVNINFPRPPL
jgi:hypothetical protein